MLIGALGCSLSSLLVNQALHPIHTYYIYCIRNVSKKYVHELSEEVKKLVKLPESNTKDDDDLDLNQSFQQLICLFTRKIFKYEKTFNNPIKIIDMLL